jgi:transcriptional regulator with XRE-family HTH domain
MNWEVLGESVRRARKEARRTQGELAASLGMSRATISALENGTIGEIGARKLDGLCQALGLELFVGPKHHRPTLKQLREERRARRDA